MTESDEERLKKAQARMLETGLRLLREGAPPMDVLTLKRLHEHEQRAYEKRIKPRDLGVT